MKEGLLFDWIALHAPDISPRYVQRPAAVETHLADALLAFRDRAAVSAGIAANPLPLNRLPQGGIALLHALVEDVTQRCHTYILLL
jgi:hypothetical protein